MSARLGLIAAAAAVTAASSQDRYDAVIVGAGWAGIRAVEVLTTNGVPGDRVLVLEAAEHAGGRCRSRNSDGTTNNPNLRPRVVPHELGAEWNYDSGINRQQDALWPDYIPSRVWDDQDYYAIWPTWPGKASYYRRKDVDGSGQKVMSKMERKDGWMAELWAPFLQFREDNLDELAGLSYGEAIEKYIQGKGWKSNDKLQFLNMVEDAKHLEYGTGDRDMDITEIEFTDPTFHVETNYMGVPGVGWGNVAAKYAQQFASNIRTSARVTEINQRLDDDYAVVRYLENGASKTVKARTVLVTVSVGVLKAGNINFVPSLPSWKRASIDAIGFGVINKCIMSWKDEKDLVWPNGQEEDRWFLMATPEDETSGRWTTFSNPSNFKGVASLTAWIGGSDAVEAEDMSDGEILGDVMRNLREMFPAIGEPDDVVVTRWGKDENVLGAYSYPSPGQDYYGDLRKIGERVGKIFFAGEATSSNGWATTFGAWDSGEDAGFDMATRILTLPKIEEEAEPSEPTETAKQPESTPTDEDPEPTQPTETTDSQSDEASDNDAGASASEPILATTDGSEPSEPAESTELPEEALESDAEVEESEPLMTESPPDGASDSDAGDSATEPVTATNEKVDPADSTGSPESSEQASDNDAEATAEELEPSNPAGSTESPSGESSESDAEASSEESESSESTGTTESPPTEGTLESDATALESDPTPAAIEELEFSSPNEIAGPSDEASDHDSEPTADEAESSEPKESTESSEDAANDDPDAAAEELDAPEPDGAAESPSDEASVDDGEAPVSESVAAAAREPEPSESAEGPESSPEGSESSSDSAGSAEPSAESPDDGADAFAFEPEISAAEESASDDDADSPKSSPAASSKYVHARASSSEFVRSEAWVMFSCAVIGWTLCVLM